MKTTLHVLVSLIFIGTVANAEDAPKRLLPEVAQALESASSITLLSLDPNIQDARPFTKKFHHYRVLGQTDVTDLGSQERVATAIKNAVRDFNGLSAACFNPRHGVRIVTPQGTTYDFVICFECNSVAIYEGEERVPNVGITGSSAPLDELLRAAKIKLAEPAE